MKILARKVYLNGKEFIVNQWPEELMDDTGYTSEASESVRNGYLLNGKDFGELFGVDGFFGLPHGFITLPEPREFECTEDSRYEYPYVQKKPTPKRFAVLLPKEEIKPAPLGEQKPINILTHLVDVCNQFEKSGESSEERKRRHDRIFQIANQLWDKWALELQDGGSRMTKDLFTLAIQDKLLKEIHSPTSEPPEEQEELWKDVYEMITWKGLDCNDLQNKYSIHRKRD